jgi:hypothetical protein
VTHSGVSIRESPGRLSPARMTRVVGVFNRKSCCERQSVSRRGIAVFFARGVVKGLASAAPEASTGGFILPWRQWEGVRRVS